MPENTKHNKTKLMPEQARIMHAQGIQSLLSKYSKQEVLLPRDVNEIITLIPQFFVICTSKGKVIGCAALEVFTAELGEVRSLAVHPDYKNQHLGAALLKAVEDYARELGLNKIMALTYVDGFFHKFGYETVEMSVLPEKVWRVCVKCPKFHQCDEIPVLKSL